MKKTLLFFLFTGLFFGTILAQKVEILTKNLVDKSIEIILKNGTKQDQSVELSCKLDGMKASDPLPKTMLVPAQSEVLFIVLSPLDIYKAYSYGTNIRYVEGDVSAVHDNSFVYRLPYPTGKSYKIDQGYNGRQTHHNQFALDFNMPQGAEITAIRDGIVTKVVENNDRGCPNESCNSYNNYILITHEDGSIADYSHLKKNGAKVSVGTKVKAGEVIGWSGATGWASGAHLHLEVYVMSWDGQKTISANYYLNKTEVGIPQEGTSYTQAY